MNPNLKPLRNPDGRTAIREAFRILGNVYDLVNMNGEQQEAIIKARAICYDLAASHWLRTSISASTVCGDAGFNATLSGLVVATENVERMLGTALDWESES